MLLDYDDMLDHVRNTLEDNNKRRPNNPNHQFRDRFMHTKRVVAWSKRLMTDYKDLNQEVIITSCIFHDVGYAFDKKDHAIYSAKIFVDYANAHGFDRNFIKEVEWIILNHSDKSLLKTTDNHNFIIVLEADLLDEEGALGIFWDLLAAGKKNSTSYYQALEELDKHSLHILNQDIMVSKSARYFWSEKKELVRDFMDQIRADLFLEE